MKLKMNSVSEHNYDLNIKTSDGQEIKLNNHQLTQEQYYKLRDLVEDIVSDVIKKELRVKDSEVIIEE